MGRYHSLDACIKFFCHGPVEKFGRVATSVAVEERAKCRGCDAYTRSLT